MRLSYPLHYEAGKRGSCTEPEVLAPVPVTRPAGTGRVASGLEGGRQVED